MLTELERPDVLVEPVAERRRIVILDDDVLLEVLIAPMAARHGYFVDVADADDRAIVALQRPRPQLLITGFTLDDGASIGLLRRLHALCPARPIALLTHECPQDVLAVVRLAGGTAALGQLEVLDRPR
jgi:DNA-binding response OmpR family regulator